MGGGALYTPKLVHALRHCCHMAFQPAPFGRTECVQTDISCNNIMLVTMDDSQLT